MDRESLPRQIAHYWRSALRPQAILLHGRNSLQSARGIFLAAFREIVCPHACGECPGCKQLLARSHPDWVELPVEEESIKIEEVREWMARLTLRPFSAPIQVGVLFNATRLTAAAESALLKLIEEPATTFRLSLHAENWQGLMPTLRSRVVPIGCPGESVRAPNPDPEAWTELLNLIERPSFHRIALLSERLQKNKEKALAFFRFAKEEFMDRARAGSNRKAWAHSVLAIESGLTLEFNTPMRLLSENIFQRIVSVHAATGSSNLKQSV